MGNLWELCLGGAVKMAPPTCSGPDASFFDGVGDSNYPSRMGQLSTLRRLSHEAATTSAIRSKAVAKGHKKFLA